MHRKNLKTRIICLILAFIIMFSITGSMGSAVNAAEDKADGADTAHYDSEWIGGKWYDSDGSQTYAFTGIRQCDTTGWWFGDTAGWYPQSKWLKIDGKYYYFTESGYMDYYEYRDGCWLGSDGAWDESYGGGHWCSDSKGWWYEDSSGWYPYNQYLWIDGTKYWFDEDGYCEIQSSNTGNTSAWYLILVNKNNPVPSDYFAELKTLANGKKVDVRIYPELQEMFNAARSNGLGLYVREGYRTRDEQQSIMNNRIKQYQDQGYSYSKAESMAKQYVAVPGTSEHELGICVDINADNKVSTDDEVFNWLDNNAYKYGFIKRYPADKSNITGISNEPWHYRYVGKTAASEMRRLNMCLEEYIAYLNQ